MTSTSQNGPGPGRPRRPATDEHILGAALELLRVGGPAALTVEAVAARSGVARTTVYRRYRNRQEIVAAALDHVVEGPLPPAELPLHSKVHWIAEQVGQLLEESLGRGSVAAVLTGSEPEFAAALRDTIERRLAVLRRLVGDDIDAGRVSRAADADALVSLLLGAYLGELLRHDHPGEGWMDGVVDLLTEALTARGPAHDAG